jgi:SAM-dependent methyltransferase
MKKRRTNPRRPPKLALYRHAVQHPAAEVALCQRVYGHYNRRKRATLLREDFAGTCAVAAEWVRTDEDHRAMAVENHGPTARWAQRHAVRALGERAGDLLLFEADVLDVASPKVDIVVALNFSVLIYHDRPCLLAYLRHARRSLRPGGVLVVDVFGGPGARRAASQSRVVRPAADSGLRPYGYTWEQRNFDAVTGRIDCRIHFDYPGWARHASAFKYDWRLWGLPELTDLMIEAGFDRAEVWLDRFDPARGRSDGYFRPVRSSPAREDWVAYVAARR